MKHHLATLALILATPLATHAQFIDEFNDNAVEGWEPMTGDGEAKSALVPNDGFVRLEVDSTQDHYNIWWAIVRKDVSSFLDMEKLKNPAYELRIETRIRASHAPRRANIMINTQRTVDYHKQLREYDLTDTSEWHTISMTTDDFDAIPGDTVYVQFGITDWGLGNHHLDIDYYKADVVKKSTNAPDLGEPLVYHPPVPPLDTFANHLPADHDTIIHAEFPSVNFNNWTNGSDHLLTVSSHQWPVLRWTLPAEPNTLADGPGILELTTHSIAKGGEYIRALGEDFGIEFGKVRIIEILGGDPDWDQSTATFQSLTQGEDIETLINGQMIFDTELVEENGGKNYITIHRPIMQRLIDGTTKGLIIRPLGAINASLYDSESPDKTLAPTLHFNVKGKGN